MTAASAATAAHRKGSAVKPLTDTALVFSRELRPVLRDPFSLLFTLVQPLVFLGLFAPLLGGMPGFDTEGALQWFVPGVLVMIVLFGTSATGSNLLFEMMTGSHERMLVTPLSRTSLLGGRALKEIVPILSQSAIIVAVSTPFGFRFSLPGAMLGVLVLALFGLGVGALSYALALPLKDREWVFWMVTQTLLFPLLILSGMLLPLDAGPAWMQAAAAVNPIAYVVEAERALFAGEFGAEAAHGALAAVLTAAVGLWVGIAAMRRAKV